MKAPIFYLIKLNLEIENISIITITNQWENRAHTKNKQKVAHSNKTNKKSHQNHTNKKNSVIAPKQTKYSTIKPKIYSTIAQDKKKIVSHTHKEKQDIPPC